MGVIGKDVSSRTWKCILLANSINSEVTRMELCMRGSISPLKTYQKIDGEVWGH
jgi:hypothetical protein